jgi:hypothetical protein
MRKVLAILFLISIECCFSQNGVQVPNDSIGVEFLKHLKKEKLWEEGLHYLKSNSLSDHTNYFRGLFHYNLEKLDSSIFFFNKVESNSIYWDQSRLLSSFQNAYEGNLLESLNLLNEYHPTDDLLKNVVNFQQSGISLLERDFDTFEMLESSYGKYYQLAPYEEVLSMNKQRIEEFNHKSPFIAGFLSGLVPGAGRFYIGKPGEGVATLLVTGIFALQSMEAYRKDGPESVRFVLFSSLLAVTYVSNIWGTVLSVKVTNLEKNQQVNEDILLNMHIPLRVIFD